MRIKGILRRAVDKSLTVDDMNTLYRILIPLRRESFALARKYTGLFDLSAFLCSVDWSNSQTDTILCI